ncbi:hypothetical protein [Planctomicrobium sp. SH664]|uniref:hypothetical protein n=1 Tax=Planctomicrobium sp. SH664 TaxID=3448125 RepID=UPI003F5BDEDD
MIAGDRLNSDRFTLIFGAVLSSLFFSMQSVSAADSQTASLIPPAPDAGTLPAAAPQSQVLPIPVISPPQAVEFANWTVVIQPNQPAAAAPRSYESIYRSIPYRRLEYLANPSYRHDATMEILFGQLRPTVINRTDEPHRITNPVPPLTQPYPISKGELWSLPWAYYTPWFSQWPTP